MLKKNWKDNTDVLVQALVYALIKHVISLIGCHCITYIKPENNFLYNISVGCETKYRLDKINSEKQFDRLVSPSKNACESVPKQDDTIFGAHPFQNTSIFDSWSTLLSSSLILEEGVKAKEESSVIEREDEKELMPCTLCKYGKRPSLLDKTIKGHEDWTCDEMDAFIPIMFEKDQASLVFIDPYQLPSCEEFQNYFGQICGCSSNEINPYSFRLAKVASSIFCLFALLFIYLRQQYYTSSRENSLESIELKSLGKNNANEESEE